jgi:hypothetical protein
MYDNDVSLGINCESTYQLRRITGQASATVQDRPGGRKSLARLAARFPGAALVWAGQRDTWANATEREAPRRMKIETQLA